MMRSRLFAVLVAAMVVGVCGVAPAASAETVTLRNSEGVPLESGTLEPGSEFFSEGYNGILDIGFGGTKVRCHHFAISSELLENSADPATFEIRSGYAANEWPGNPCTAAQPWESFHVAEITSGVASFNPDGSGSIPLNMTVLLPQQGWTCEMSGNVSLLWSEKHSELKIYGVVSKTGPGSCYIQAMNVSGWTGSQVASDGKPIKITTP